MRVLLSREGVRILFETVARHESFSDVAEQLNVATRTLRDWRARRFSMPLSAYEQLLRLSGLGQGSFSPKVLPDFWHSKAAGRRGALVRLRLYGNFGTAEGRRRGGLASLRTHYRIRDRFKVLRPIARPRCSDGLAELLGILVGDGHISTYQVGITTNSKTDLEHARFVQKLLQDLFRVKATLQWRRGENALSIVVSSKAVVDFLHRFGMPMGNKIQHNLAIPHWVMRTRSFQKAFVRGLFDTDGCIYLDRHCINGRHYAHLGWTITSHASALRSDIIAVLRRLRFSPTHQPSQQSVYLRRGEEVIRYFQEVGTSNPKHLRRYHAFLGRVPKWS